MTAEDEQMECESRKFSRYLVEMSLTHLPPLTSLQISSKAESDSQL